MGKHAANFKLFLLKVTFIIMELGSVSHSHTYKMHSAPFSESYFTENFPRKCIHFVFFLAEIHLFLKCIFFKLPQIIAPLTDTQACTAYHLANALIGMSQNVYMPCFFGFL